MCGGEQNFMSTSTQILKSVCVPGHNIFNRQFVGRHQGYCTALPDLKNWLPSRENNILFKFKVHFIHSKKVPLLHKTVLIYAMKEMDWWP